MDVLKLFAGFQCIYGFCPCCGEPFRLSDAQLFVSGPPPKTDFDRIADEQRKLDLEVDRFDEREEALREASTRRGRDAARARLSEIAPFFVSRRIDPNDVKVLFDPVRYLAFRGMNAGSCTELQFIDSQPENERHRKLHRSLHAAIKRGNLEWRTLHVQEDGSITSS